MLQFLGHFLQASFKYSYLIFLAKWDFLLLLFIVRVRWHRANWNSRFSEQNIWVWFLFYQQSDGGSKSGMAGWDALTLPLWYAIPSSNAIPRLDFLITYGSNDNFYFSEPSEALKKQITPIKSQWKKIKSRVVGEMDDSRRGFLGGPALVNFKLWAVLATAFQWIVTLDSHTVAFKLSSNTS